MPSTGASPLLTAAAPLLQLLGRLNSLNAPPDDVFRDSVVKALQRFRDTARDAGFDENTIRTAHYALCASLDDVIMNSQWSTASRWKENSLVAEYHRNVSAGEGFFRQLEDLQRNPTEHLPLLELMYYCLSLGFVGRYRPSLDVRGAGRHESLRDELYETLRRLQPRGETELSPHWRGEDAPYRPSRAILPAWAIAAGVAACLVGVFLFLSGLLEHQADAVLTAAASAGPPMPTIQRAVAPRPPPPPPENLRSAAAVQIHKFLDREIAEGLVSVNETATITRVRIRASGMYPSGIATIQPGFVPLLQRIGEALNSEPGRVHVIGHTDNQPIRTARFRSNFELSSARADAARAVIATTMREPGRVVSEGRADLEPLLANDTPAGREANRRVEVILQRQD